MLVPGITFLTASFASWGLGVVVYQLLLAWNVVDRPNARSSHSHPTVRGGGIAIVAVILSANLWLVFERDSWLLAILGCSAFVLSWVSFVDDRRPVSPLARFSFHCLAAVGLALLCLWYVPQFPKSAALTNPGSAAVICGLASVWVVGYTNAFNFMDGIDGLAATQATLTALGMAGIAIIADAPPDSPTITLCCVVAGSAAGFLPHNFPRARMFMGDVGSAPLGFLLASLAILIARDTGWWLLAPLVCLHANFILDTGITLLRRIWRGEIWYEAHREHFYQRLVRSGKSHVRVTSLELILQTIVLGLMALYVLEPELDLRAGLIAAVLVIWTLFFIYCETQFRKTSRPKPLGHASGLCSK